MVDFLQVHVELVGPEGGPLAHRGELGGLAVGVGKAGHGLVFVGEFGQQGKHAQQLFAHQLQRLAHDDDVGVVAHIAAGGAQVDDALGVRALQAVGVDVAHHVVAALLLPADGVLIVDVVGVGLQLGDLLVGDGKALPLFGFGQGDPEFSPSTELVVVGEDVLHLPAGVAGLEGGNVSVVFCHSALRSLSFEKAAPSKAGAAPLLGYSRK